MSEHHLGDHRHDAPRHNRFEDMLAAVLDHTATDKEHARALAAGIAELLKTCWRIETMTQALVDAVTGLNGAVQTLSSNLADHDTKVQGMLSALQAALAASTAQPPSSDPDVARAIDAISQASSGISAAAQQIATESAAMANAVAPPAPPAADAAPPAAPATGS